MFSRLSEPQQQSLNRNANIWLYDGSKCSIEKWKHLTSDQRWAKNDGEVLCTRKAVIADCERLAEEKQNEDTNEANVVEFMHFLFTW